MIVLSEIFLKNLEAYLILYLMKHLYNYKTLYTNMFNFFSQRSLNYFNLHILNQALSSYKIKYR